MLVVYLVRSSLCFYRCFRRYYRTYPNNMEVAMETVKIEVSKQDLLLIIGSLTKNRVSYGAENKQLENLINNLATTARKEISDEEAISILA